MQIDFHHTVTYVAARFAGFDHDSAAVVAYAAQHVDDATGDHRVAFDNHALYTRICSAHKSLDPHNLDQLSNHLVWVPFHFLPGNGGAKAGANPAGTFIDKIRCLPGHHNPVAQDMIAAVIQARHKPNALHRLGITMHVFADTWAHQGFAGVLHRVNVVNNLEDIGSSRAFGHTWLGDILGDVVPPVGHGQARIFPDMPFLRWVYENGRGEFIQRDNPSDFREAADGLCRAMQRFRGVPETGIPKADLDHIHALFTGKDATTVKASRRHALWLSALAAGEFSFGRANLAYAEGGPESWKTLALGTGEERPEYPYAPAFLTSHWKRFHDALQEHRLTLLHDILPNYGICAG